MIFNLTKNDAVIISEVENRTKTYFNTPSGRAEFTAEQPLDVVVKVMKTWGDAPTQKDAPPQDMTLDEVRTEKLTEISAACNIEITAGCDVTLADGSTGHFSLMETDQINLTAAVAAVEQGATGYPYHADGKLCKLFPAADIVAVAQAATAHKLYHTTYCNHLLVWARRAETVAEMDGITYGVALPDDLAANMQEVLAGARGL